MHDWIINIIRQNNSFTYTIFQTATLLQKLPLQPNLIFFETSGSNKEPGSDYGYRFSYPAVSTAWPLWPPWATFCCASDCF